MMILLRLVVERVALRQSGHRRRLIEQRLDFRIGVEGVVVGAELSCDSSTLEEIFRVGKIRLPASS